ncbi:MAG: nicotinate-nucleotide adenylyltransferase [Saprospiraceae bacterium]|nr:nicotinate-nucleotide adenylyltransferase [Saprospiraceae bacterium]
MKVGLFFGSFNPVHVGHMIIANFMAQNTDLDQVWMVVSPQNPLKKKNSLAKDRDRIHLVNLAIGDNLLLRSSDVEFSMPKPSYTIDTLAYLGEKYPKYEFVLIMGGDNLRTIHKWKNYEKLISDYNIYIYKRPKYSTKKWEDHATIKIYEAPLLDISASYIRDQVKRRHSIQYLVPQEVYEYLDETRLYEKLLKKTEK